MDPITLIVTAIASGAAAGASGVATEAVRDAYAGFKALVIRKFGSTGAVEANLQQVETEPENEIWQAALQQGLVQAGADSDQEVLTQAQALLDLLAELDLYAGPTYAAHVEGSGAIAQDHSVAAGGGGVAVKGDVYGPIIHGDRNIVGDVGGDVDMSDRHVEQQGKYNINIGSAAGVTIGDQAQIAQQFGREAARPAAPDPAAELELLQEQRQAQKLLLATYRKQLVLASGSEAAKLEVQIGQLEQDIRSVERRIDELQANRSVNR